MMQSITLPRKGARRLWSQRSFLSLVTWSIAVLLFLNTLYYVLRVSSPVIRSDDWYFLQVFLHKAIDGNLGFADFFVKRPGADHAQPLFKLILLLDWHYFHLDFVVEAAIGVMGAAASALILYRVAVSGTPSGSGWIAPLLAWVTICGLLFSLNGAAATWTWSLVTLENLTTAIILLFFVVVWRALQRGQYFLLVLTTLLLGITSDDSALVAAIASGLSLIIVQMRETSAQSRLNTLKCLGVIALCMIFARMGYSYAPIVGASGFPSFAERLALLPQRLQEGGWWSWVALPLIIPVSYDPFHQDILSLWPALRAPLVFLLIFLHVMFWKKALGLRHNRATFVATCLMLLSYAWIAGIILGRVSVFGNDYLNQPRYVLLYTGHLIALILMWAGSVPVMPRLSFQWQSIASWAPAVGCVALLAVQIPLSTNAWRLRIFEWAYQTEMAQELVELANDPAKVPSKCLPELVVCALPVEDRRVLLGLLTQHKLNVFSPAVQRRHRRLPRPSDDSSQLGATKN